MIPTFIERDQPHILVRAGHIVTIDDSVIIVKLTQLDCIHIIKH